MIAQVSPLSFACLYLVCVSFQHTGLAKPAPDANTPCLELLGTNTISLGRISEFKHQQATFLFTNRSDQTLSVLALRRTCSCINSSIDRKSVPPGGSAVVTMGVDPTSIRGSFTRGLWVSFPGAAKKRVLLSLTGEVMPLFDGLPSKMIDLRSPFVDNVCWTNRYILTATDPRVRLGTPVVGTNSYMKVEASLVTNASEKTSYTLSLVSTPLSRGRAKTQILLPVTGIKDIPDLRIGIASRVGLALSVNPDGLFLIPTDFPVKRRFLVRTDAEVAEPAALTWSPQIEGLFIEAKQTKTKSGLLITLQLSPETVTRLLAQKETPLTFHYPQHTPATVLIQPAKEEGEEDEEKEEEGAEQE